MTGTHRNEESEELLNRAVATTRQLPLPTGPSPAIMSRTLVALREAASQPDITFLQRIYHMPWTTKIAAALATAASLLVVYVGLSNLTGSAPAFADVVEVLNSVRSATWKTTTEIKELQEGSVSLLGGGVTTTRSYAAASEEKRPQNETGAMRGAAERVSTDENRGPQNETVTFAGVGMFLAPAHERMESTGQGVKSIQIVDGEKDQALTLIPATKMAIVIQLKNLPPGRESPFGKTFQGLRELVVDAQSGKTGKAERLGVETIDGRPAEGFRIQLGSTEVKIWADPKTLLPVRVEQTTTSGPKVRHVMSDFKVDVELNKELFSLELPKGYTLQQTAQIDLAKDPIHYLAETLRLTAEVNDGVFPPTLRGDDGIDGILMRSPEKLAKAMGSGAETPQQSRDTGIKLSMNLGATFGFLGVLSAEQNDWHYAGKDVKLNAPNRPIFWLRRHKASETYQVLYADLSVKEVSRENVPKAPAPNPQPGP
ncbi:MAG: outer membrane lipoprotein carrier protein LolA [Pirellulales bacterium]